MRRKETRKDVVERTPQGPAPTIRQGLDRVTAADAYERLRALRGKMKIGYDWKKLRED